MTKSIEPQINACFVISGNDFDTDSCTNAIGISPTKIWRQAHEELKHHKDIDNTNWIIETGKLKMYSINDVLNTLLNTLRPYEAKIRNYLLESGLQGSFTCFVTIYYDRPAYELSSEVMQKMAFFNCDFGMDIYDYSE